MSKEKVGLVFGCFIPMHKGHLYMIDKALEENDRIVLGVCGFDDDRGKDFIPFKVRQELLTSKYRYNDKVTLSIVDDKKIGLEGKFDENAWRIWGKEFFTNANVDPDDANIEFTWYTGEQRYIDEIQKVYPKHTFVLLDRGINTISGTAIRNDLKHNLTQIDPVFLRYIFDVYSFD